MEDPKPETPLKTKEIRIQVDVDGDQIPRDIRWAADDTASLDDTQSRAMFLSLWDSRTKDTFKLDLWTHKMTVDEMKIFFHQTLTSMADSLERATKDERITGDMRDFCDYFAERMDIKEKP
ncbi:MAG: gliding motility protein GldC [Balneolaceae bacterium]|nr:gliding motility protein GldC [Balneolaceae bacterium]MDR9446582.1 gliding motility protein GldC [Balneolaceae bacterium]